MDTTTPGGNGFKTSEFTALLTLMATNVITALVMFGYVKPTDAGSLTEMVTALIVAAIAVGANTVGLWKYVAQRQALKVEDIKAKAEALRFQGTPLPATLEVKT